MQHSSTKKHYGKYVFRWIMAFLLVALLVFGAVCGVRVYHFYQAMNEELPVSPPSVMEYPVRGVDVSRHQGEIDWETFSRQSHVQFAFIKATEGSTYQDDRFAENWLSARENDVYVGAYHFFRFDSDGASQADNFIGMVPKGDNTLPPVIDIELYEGAGLPDKSAVRKELDVMIRQLEIYYGVKPILYTNPATYLNYLAGSYFTYPLWMSNPYCEPITNWSFWQYSFEGELEGFVLEDIPVDLNVYRGTKKEFMEQFGLQ